MKLDEYLNDVQNNTGATRAMTIQVFADLIGVSANAVYQYLSGRIRPSFDTLSQIMLYTEGKVGFQDFIVDHAEDQRADICGSDGLPVRQPPIIKDSP